MKAFDINTVQLPVIYKVAGTIKEVQGKPKKHSFSALSLNVGDTIEFPDTVKDVTIYEYPVGNVRIWNPFIQSRDERGRFSKMGVYEWKRVRSIVLLVKINGTPNFIDVKSLMRTFSYEETQTYKLHQQMSKYLYSERKFIRTLLGKTIQVSEKKECLVSIYVDDKMYKRKDVLKEIPIFKSLRKRVS